MTSSSSPVPKVAAAGIGGAVSTVLVWLLALIGVAVPGGVAAAITMLAAFGSGYMKTDYTAPAVPYVDPYIETPDPGVPDGS